MVLSSPIRRMVTGSCLFIACLASGIVFRSSAIAADETAPATGAIEGYSDFATFSKQVQALAKPGLASVKSLTKSLGGREVWLITLGSENNADDKSAKLDQKPAILIVGNVDAAQLVGSELAYRMAQQLIDGATKQDTATDDDAKNDTAKNDDAKKERTDTDAAISEAEMKTAKQLLDRYTLYIIPRPNPDGSEAFFTKPRRPRAGNARPTDDDRDDEVGEDPADDLNNDGLITTMRVADPAGKFLPHPTDPRIMIEADPKKNERGQYSLYVEGRDDDGDESFNEDGSTGVSLNRNFTFRYPFFGVNAGPHQVSEPESRAIADFAFDHPNIAAVFCFSPEDNLFHPWKAGNETGKIKTSIQSGDAATLEPIVEKYRKLHGGADAPASPRGEGSFSEWAYFHYGRWSFAGRGWWVPKVKAEKAVSESKDAKSDDGKKDDNKLGESKQDDAKKDDSKKSDNKKEPADPKPDTRGADQLNALAWLEREKIEGFVPWQVVEHPDFRGKRVEVGGFRPFVLDNPPAKELPALATKHAEFVLHLANQLPQLKIDEVKIDALGGGVHRITCTVLNTGHLPTMSEMGKTSGAAYPLQISIELPEATTFIQGTPRRELPRLSGLGDKNEVIWLVRTAEGKPAVGKIVVYAPAVGRVEAAVELK